MTPAGRRLAALGVTGAFAALVLRPPFALVRLVAAILPQVLFYVDTDRPVIALSFDDGPHPATTPGIVDALGRHGARATFFLLGARAAAHPAMVVRIVGEGHEVANHSWEEERSARLAARVLEERLRRAHRALGAGAPVALFRPGSGWVTPGVLRVTRRQGYRCVLGSVYPQDAWLRVPRWVAFDVLRRVRPGAIVILHEGTPERVAVLDVLEAILPELRRRGYRIETVSGLLRAGPS